MKDPTYPAYPICAALALVMLWLPAPWHFKSRNIGTISLIIWLTLDTFIYFVNSIVWFDNVKNHASWWCDFCTKILVTASMSVPMASMLINRRLYQIATVKTVHITDYERKKNMYIDLFLAFGTPLIYMALHYVNQGHRYDILENIGCWTSTYPTPVAIATLYIWPFIIAGISCVYCTLSIRAFLKQRRQFDELLQSRGSGLSVNRYFRLMALACTDMIATIPLYTYIFYMNVSNLRPWISWADTKYGFNRVDYYAWAWITFEPSNGILVNLARWIPVASCWVFFFFFGLAGESGVFYKKYFWWIMSWFGVFPTKATKPAASWVNPTGTTSLGVSTVPAFNHIASVSSSIQHGGKRDSLDDDIYPYETKDNMKSTLSLSDSASDSQSPSDLDEKDAALNTPTAQHVTLPALPKQTYQPNSPSEVPSHVV